MGISDLPISGPLDEEFYKTYLNSDIKSILSQSLSVTEHVKKLGEGIEALNKELQGQVLEHHNDLLKQASHATKLENVLNAINIHIQNLFANAERLKSQINVPYEALETHTKVLKNLHSASHILRQLSRVQQLSKRLSNTNDPVQKAAILQELEQLATDSELSHIDAVTTELRNIRIQRQNVIKIASSSLHQGILNENFIQTSTALQVFLNLGTIKSTIENLTKQSLEECREVISMSLKVGAVTMGKNKAGPGRVSLATSQDFRNKMWVELDKSFSEDIFNSCKQMKYLFTALEEMRLKNIDQKLAREFWKNIGEIFQKEISQASGAVQQALEEDYPRLLKMYSEMVKKLNYKQFHFNSTILKSLENSYLSNSLNRMLQPTQLLFSSSENSVPSHDEIDNLIRTITNELSVALVEENLSKHISNNVAKCIKMFAVKMEQQIDNSPEAAQVIAGNPNTLQQKNVQYANLLYYMQMQTYRMLSNMKGSLPENGAKIIEDSLKSIESLSEAMIQPLVSSINSIVETIIITMHLEKDWTKTQMSQTKIQSASPYMRELSQFLNRVYNTYLSNFQNKKVLSQKCNEISLRCIELFIRHAVILRPIAHCGRQKLQTDSNYLEAALKVLTPNLADLGKPYRILKSMTLLFTLSPEEISSSQASGSSVPDSTVLLMLFSHAGPDLASPHQNTSWSLPKLSTWLDEHPSETERLDLIAGALQKYEAFTRQKNSASYDPVYPVMANLLEKALKNSNV